MRCEKKGQAASEFLISYGWMILVIATAISLLFVYFIHDKSNFIREECSLSAGLSCSDFAIDENSINIVIKNNLDWDISNVKFTYDDCIINSAEISLDAGETATFALSECNFFSGELFDSNGLIVDYTLEGNSISHQKNVNIVSVVEGGNSQNYGGERYNPDAATLLLCHFDDGTDCELGISPIVSKNVTIVGGYFDNSVFIEEKINLIENGDFEGTLPSYWNPYNQNNLTVSISDNFANSGEKSALTFRDGDLLYPGFCDEATCSYYGSCTWDSVNNQCSYSSACTTNCGAHICGSVPDVYNEGEELCWGNTNRVMYGGTRYGGDEMELSQNLNINIDTEYTLSFMYKGSFPRNLNAYICYNSGWCDSGLGYPSIILADVPLGDFSSWQYYSDSFIYTNSFFTDCDGSSCFREMIFGKFSYGDTQAQGDSFYVDDVQLEEGDIAGPFAGDGSDILKYPADETTLNLEIGTFEAWVYVDDEIRESSQNRYIFAHQSNCEPNCYSNRISLGHTLNNIWLFTISNSAGESISISRGDSLSVGWHHFAAVWDKNTDGGYIGLFIDGYKVEEETEVSNYFPSDYEDGIYIGQWSPSYGWVNTQIDEIRISDYVRYT